MTFEVQHTDSASNARAGLIMTDHGPIQTPIFMPVGTVGSVKAVHFSELREQVKAQIILGNTYHLYLRPGLDILRKAGGLHQFNTCDYQYAAKSLKLTQHWLDRCVRRFNETEPLYGYHQTLFPIVQGCTYKDLRQDAAKHVVDTLGKLNDGGGASIGGLAVGEPTEVMYEMIEVVNEILPKDRPRYLMGVGTPQNILESIERGVDMFDCVMPTRNGRNAMLFTYQGTMNMRNKKWEDDFSPIDPDGCEIDLIHSKAYLHHLFKAQELLAMQIASIHNLAFYLRLVTDARQHICQGDFVQWKRSVIEQLGQRV